MESLLRSGLGLGPKRREQPALAASPDDWRVHQQRLCANPRNLLSADGPVAVIALASPRSLRPSSARSQLYSGLGRTHESNQGSMRRRLLISVACAALSGCGPTRSDIAAASPAAAPLELRLAGAKRAAWNTAVTVLNDSGYRFAGSDEDRLRFVTPSADVALVLTFDSLPDDSVRVRITAHSYDRDAPTPQERVGQMLNPSDMRWNAVTRIGSALSAQCGSRCRDPHAGAVPILDP